jgi:hypothetical protein
MSTKKDLVTPEEIDNCIRYISDNSNTSAQDQFSKLVREIQIILDEPKIEDSIDGTRVRVTYTMGISRKSGGKDDGVIRFQYLKEVPVDYSTVPIRLRDKYTTASGSAAHDEDDDGDVVVSEKNNVNAEDTIIESYDEIENSVPKLREVLGLLKRIYFMPEDFSNKLVVDRIHELRNMFSRDEILILPTIDPNDKAGLIPI